VPMRSNRRRCPPPLAGVSWLSLVFVYLATALASDPGFTPMGPPKRSKTGRRIATCPGCEYPVDVSSVRRVRCGQCPVVFAVYPCWKHRGSYFTIRSGDKWDCPRGHSETFRLCPELGCSLASRNYGNQWKCSKQHIFQVRKCSCGSWAAERKFDSIWICEINQHTKA